MTFVLLAGCGGGANETTVPSNDLEPGEVVTEWLGALSGPDVVDLASLVEPVGLAVVAAVENNLRSDELVGLLRSGLGDELAADYWGSFRDDFEAIHGESLSAITVGDLIRIPSDDEHVAVAISTETSEGRVVLRRAGAGWRIDFVATVGPALVGPMGEYISSALAGEYAAEVAEACTGAVVPGLEAASALDQGNTNLAFETEYIRQLVATGE
jgi:hypothetical protein